VSEQLELFQPTTDAPARDLVRSRLDATVFVEAGAGTGKTAILVDRLVALVVGDGRHPGVPMRNVAAITFTEKAASELRDRVREELLRRGEVDAADQLDEAAICTLHAFAQRILTEFPIEAGLPPRIVIRDEISSRVAFEERWRRFVDALLEDAELEQTIHVMLAAAVRLDSLRTVAEILDDNWDLLDRVPEAPALPALDLAGWLGRLDEVCAAAGECRLEPDTMSTRLADLALYRDRLRAAFDDIERVQLLRLDKPSFRVSNCGRKNNWPDIVELRDRISKLGADRDAILQRILDAAIRRIVAALARGTTAAVGERRAAGELEFHDLLVLARTLLRDPTHGARARTRLREHYERILIDEFQDTDPIQLELATLLASADADAATRAWNEIAIEPGRLFFVGDPKQSIYRFRRADIAMFLEAARRFADPAPLYLTQNFRTAPGVLDWINAVFGELIRPHEGSQPAYRALDAARTDAVNARVALLGVDAHDDQPAADDLRIREADDVAAAVERVIGERWPVFDREQGVWRDARLGDICVLLPARTSLGFLERALDDAGVPYRAESSSLVYATREVRDLLAALRAIDDPGDALALVSALRSSLFGCGDDDLFVYHVEHNGTWDIRFPPPDTLPPDDPVGSAIRYLGALHDERVWSTASELLERIVRERRVLEVAAGSGRFRDVARRIRFVVDQARAYADAEGGGLRDYLAWAALQSAEGARVVEAVLPETDDDAVRILTIHGAKGLEFPIVICSGTTTAAVTPRRGVQVLFPAAGGCEVRMSRGVQTAHFELHQPVDEQMDFHEKLRLLYVACTRARDHLVVSVHRKARDLDEVEPTKWTNAELLWDASRDAPVPPDPGRQSRRPAPIAREALPAVIAPDEWAAEHAIAFDRGARRAFVAATTLAQRGDERPKPDPGLAKNPRDLELPPWNKGRFGTAIGRAVHAVLQTVDLASGAGLEDAARAQAAAEGVLGREDTIAALARAAIESAVVQRAASCPRWRETYVAIPLAGLTLEGYVDLVFRDVDGLVVVDYKTDAVPDADALETALAHYRVQVAAYALAISEATGERVARGVLCFLHPEGAREVVLEGADLTAAVEDVRARAAAEHERPSPLPAPTLAEV
jgi:ATP-dependent exoDNAse (exonuclease V) beta subunit